jgi:hypothetical protein
MVGQDSATQFYPWYGYLGERLRAGELPGWNIHQFGGAPFAADPQSGWTYLPAMFFFTVFPLALAAKLFIFGHVLLAGLGAFTLGRLLNFSLAGALVAGAAFELSGVVYGRSACCPATTGVASWLPILLICAEMALRAPSWRIRWAWWALGGGTLSQTLAIWPGQGSLYAVAALGLYLAYRTLGASDLAASWPKRFGSLASHGAAILALGIALGAAALLPRLEYNALSNLAGGAYTGDQLWAANLGGWPPSEIPGHLLRYSVYYAGTTVLALALIALPVARRRYGAPFFALLFGLAAIFSLEVTTPLHRLLYLVPTFEVLNNHWPERVMMVGILAPAMLAGAAVTALPNWWRSSASLVAIAATPALALQLLSTLGVTARRPATILLVLTCILIAAFALLFRPRLRRALPAALIVLVAIDLLIAGGRLASNGPYGGFAKVDLDAYYAPTGAAAFLQARTGAEPARFIGYNPAIRTVENGFVVTYRHQFLSSRTSDLVVNNRAMPLGLEDLQGYNPVQPARFVETLNALNGRSQEYHGATVFAEGLRSPLLDLLNVRYIIVPNRVGQYRDDVRQLRDHLPTVYMDSDVRVLENTAALPRAWLVHDARLVGEGEALSLLAEGKIDPRQVALFEGQLDDTLNTQLASLSQPPITTTDSVEITARAPERLLLTTSSAAAGLLVLSELTYPGWKATVDGQPVAMLTTDHLLRGVIVPAGTHQVELIFRSTPLLVGLWISGATGLVMIALLGNAWGARRVKRNLVTRWSRLRACGLRSRQRDASLMG